MTTRRDFIKYSAATAALSAISIPSIGSRATLPITGNRGHYLDKGTRLTIAMWDFSWLTAHHEGGAYESLEQRVVEAAERGFNTLRIDCFPSRILEGKSSFKKNYTPGIQLPFWGQCAVDHEEDVLDRLTVLANACRKHNIWLGLDSWEKGHMIKKDNVNLFGINNIIQPEEEEKIFRGFSDTWVRALKLMREAGILERAVWVAPMNEVPHFVSHSVQNIQEIGSKSENQGGTRLETNEKLNKKYQQINHWIGEAIKNEISKEKIPLSYSSCCGIEEYNKRLTNIYDVVDVHFLPSVIMNPEQTNDLVKIAKGGRGFSYFEKMDDLSLYSKLWDNSCRDNYPAMLSRVRDYFKSALETLDLPNGKKLKAVITESYGPCYWPDHKDVSWKWYQNYNGDAARIAASFPYVGLSLSNYSEPLFSLWDDVDWHRNSNLFILNNVS